MSMSETTTAHDSLHRDNYAVPNGPVVSSLLPSLGGPGAGGGSAFTQPGHAGAGANTPADHSEPARVRHRDEGNPDWYEVGRPSLRDPGLEAAVDKIVGGIDRELTDLSQIRSTEEDAIRSNVSGTAGRHNGSRKF